MHTRPLCHGLSRMHEMCHALLYLAYECSVYNCELNRMNAWGTTGHGPSWQRVRAAAQETANIHLEGFSEPFLLAHPKEPDMKQEARAKVRLLEGLYTKIKRDEHEVERGKKLERKKKRAVKIINTVENDRRKADNDETLACVVTIFERWEKIADAVVEEISDVEGSNVG